MKIQITRAPVFSATLLSVLSIASTMSQAQITKNIGVECEFPLVGTETVIATIETDYPSAVYPGNPIPAVDVKATFKFPNKTRQGLRFVDAATMTGSAEIISTLQTITGDYENNIPLNLEATEIPPDPVYNFDVIAYGKTPIHYDYPAYSTQTISIDSIKLMLKNLKIDGEPAPEPIGQLTVDCNVLDGQSRTLAEIGPDGIITIPKPPGAENILSPQEVHFGFQPLGQSVTTLITATNNTNELMGINGVNFSDEGTDAFNVTHNCSSILSPFQSCNIEVTYLAHEIGNHNLEITVETTDTNEPTYKATVSGSTIENSIAEIHVPSEKLNFGESVLGGTTIAYVDVFSTGTASLNIESIEVAGEGFFLNNLENCVSLPPGKPSEVDARCRISIGFEPMNSGEHSGTLTILSNAYNNQVVQLPLSGKGTLEGCVQSDDDLSFVGKNHIKSSNTNFELLGMVIDHSVNLCAKEIIGELQFEPSLGSFEMIQGWNRYLATAKMEIETITPFIGQFDDNSFTASTSAYIKLPIITKTLFGLFHWRIGGGENCRTKTPVEFSFSAASEGESNRLSATYELPEFENCGFFTEALNKKLSGTGNTLQLEFTGE